MEGGTEQWLPKRNRSHRNCTEPDMPQGLQASPRSRASLGRVCGSREPEEQRVRERTHVAVGPCHWVLVTDPSGSSRHLRDRSLVLRSSSSSTSVMETGTPSPDGSPSLGHAGTLPYASCVWRVSGAALWVSDGACLLLAFRGLHGAWALVQTLARQGMDITSLPEVLPEEEPVTRKLVTGDRRGP